MLTRQYLVNVNGFYTPYSHIFNSFVFENIYEAVLVNHMPGKHFLSTDRN